ncbi:MAG: hypothetical protein JOZ18_01160 [Chloroflexi bacterium]|nr:hypothetical protein [Chloroflexota bacterium]
MKPDPFASPDQEFLTYTIIVREQQGKRNGTSAIGNPYLSRSPFCYT